MTDIPQPIGQPVPGWTARPAPPRTPMQGRFCRVEPLDPARHSEELGYRRYEWKCDTLNAPSRAAAARLGFKHEGLFRQAVVNKGRNRDTDWFSIIDSEWPALRRAYEAWLSEANFDVEGRQKRGL